MTCQEPSVAEHPSEFVPGVDGDKRGEIHAPSLRLIASFLFLVLLSSRRQGLHQRRMAAYKLFLTVALSEEEQTTATPLFSPTLFVVLKVAVLVRQPCARRFCEYLYRKEWRMMSSRPPSLDYAPFNLSHGFDYKLLPFTISGAIHHLWDLLGHFLSGAFSCLVTVKQHSTSACSHCSSAFGTAKRKTADESRLKVHNHYSLFLLLLNEFLLSVILAE